MAKMTLKARVSHDHDDVYVVQIWWFQPKSTMSYCADKASFLEF